MKSLSPFVAAWISSRLLGTTIQRSPGLMLSLLLILSVARYPGVLSADEAAEFRNGITAWVIVGYPGAFAREAAIAYGELVCSEMLNYACTGSTRHLPAGVVSPPRSAEFAEQCTAEGQDMFDQVVLDPVDHWVTRIRSEDVPLVDIPPLVPAHPIVRIPWAVAYVATHFLRVDCRATCLTQCDGGRCYNDPGICNIECDQRYPGNDCGRCVFREDQLGGRCQYVCQRRSGCGCLSQGHASTVAECRASNCQNCVERDGCVVCKDPPPPPPPQTPGPERPTEEPPQPPGRECVDGAPCNGMCNGRRQRGTSYCRPDGSQGCAIGCVTLGGIPNLDDGASGDCDVNIGSACPADCASCNYHY